MSPLRSLALGLLGCALVLTACGPRISDTGYTGTWSREGSDVVTTISIANVDGEYLFRWGRETLDGVVQVRCDWDGLCEENVDGEPVATYQMHAWIDDESGLLRVECRGRRIDREGGEVEVHYLDELVVRNDGKRLVSRVRGRNGEIFEGLGHGRRVFEKISDSVVDPPERGTTRD
jgi:hypothetical protein